MSEKISPFGSGIPPLNALRVFESAARQGSFVQAATELHVTHGAVSRQIQQLESRLGVLLFERRNRAVFLTREGAELQAVCSDVMKQLATAFNHLRTKTEHEPLVFSCEPTIAMRWVIPRLPAFRARYPAQQLHLLTAGGPIDFRRDRVDVALRRNDFNWDHSLHVAKVAPELMGPVCRREIAETILSAWQETTQLPRMLHSRSRRSAWERWSETSGRSLKLGEPEYFEHFYLCLQAASAGLGVGIGSAYMVEADIGDERLVAPFGFIPDGSEYVLLSPVPFASDARRMQFVDWLRYEMAQSRLLFE